MSEQASKHSKMKRIESFNFTPGRILARKYVVESRLGSGWEGEVYMLRELATGIERAGKFFFPHRNPDDKASGILAKKLHKLRDCQVLIRYHTQETITFKGHSVTCLISDYVEGELLSQFLQRQKGKRLHYFEALHLLYALAQGVRCIHNLKEYHGDIHSDNIIIQRYGIGFKIRLIDLYHWGRATPANIYDDVCNMIHVFYESLGGAKYYAQMPAEVKSIVCGLKRTLILKKFKTAGQLCHFLDHLSWE